MGWPITTITVLLTAVEEVGVAAWPVDAAEGGHFLGGRPLGGRVLAEQKGSGREFCASSA